MFGEGRGRRLEEKHDRRVILLSAGPELAYANLAGRHQVSSMCQDVSTSFIYPGSRSSKD